MSIRIRARMAEFRTVYQVILREAQELHARQREAAL